MVNSVSRDKILSTVRNDYCFLRCKSETSTKSLALQATLSKLKVKHRQEKNTSKFISRIFLQKNLPSTLLKNHSRHRTENEVCDINEREDVSYKILQGYGGKIPIDPRPEEIKVALFKEVSRQESVPRIIFLK